MIRLIEELSINSWPAAHTLLYDGWVLRLANGYTRANLGYTEAYTYWYRVFA